jgi:uncharacterized protein (TIGR02271 family)
MVTSSYENFVVAYFPSHSDAEIAVRDLQTAGFRSDQIGSSYDDEASYDEYDTERTGVAADQAYGASATETEGTEHRSFWEKMRDFFSSEPEHDRENTAYADHQAEWHNGGIAVPGRYRELLAKGGALISVRTEDRKAEAQDILTRNNGQIDREFGGATVEQPVASGQPDLNNSRVGEETPERRIQLISEVLRVRKDRVSSGEVRLRKEVRTETQNVQVPVTREEIVIERNPVNDERPASGAIGDNNEVRVPLTEERVQVDKVPVVREEVRVGKRPVSDTQNVSDQVRREELEVDGADDKVRDSIKGRKTA